MPPPLGWTRSRTRCGADIAVTVALCLPDGPWRDMLAFTWQFTTAPGAPSIVAMHHRLLPRTKPSGIRRHPGRAPPGRVVRAGTETIETIFVIATSAGTGVVRLVADPSEPRRLLASTLVTTVDTLADDREGSDGPDYSRDFGGELCNMWRPHRARRTVGHCQQPRTVPDLFEVSRPEDMRAPGQGFGT